MAKDIKISIRNLYKIFGPTPDVALEHVRKGMGKAELLEQQRHVLGLRDINVDMHDGEITVIMGLSGSGKSTLIRHLNRLIDPTAGEIHVDGEDIMSYTEEQLRKLRRERMSMVFQKFALLPHKTVLENIAFPLQVKGAKTQDSIKRAAGMIELVGLGGRENYFPRQLSGGQQQRVGIARSLVVEPDIWFLDEPFSALDPLIRKEMQDEFLRLQGILNKTILFVTHDFDEALRLADRIAIMKDGIIEQIDTPANIVLNPSTEYVAKFTNDVPREKVLNCANVMEKIDDALDLSELRVSKDAIIETIAEAVLNEPKPVAVVGDNNETIGVLNSKTIIHTLFGKNGLIKRSVVFNYGEQIAFTTFLI